MKSPQDGEGIDRSTFKRLIELGRRRDATASIIRSFLVDLPRYSDCIHDGFVEADFEKLTNAAHSLIGSAGMIGALRLSELCRELEDLARKESMNAVEEQIKKVRDEAVVVERELNELMTEPAS